MFCIEKWLKAQQYMYKKIFWWSWKCFLYMISVFPAYFIFRHLNYPRNCALMKAGVAIGEPPSSYAF